MICLTTKIKSNSFITLTKYQLKIGLIGQHQLKRVIILRWYHPKVQKYWKNKMSTFQWKTSLAEKKFRGKFRQIIDITSDSRIDTSFAFRFSLEALKKLRTHSETKMANRARTSLAFLAFSQLRCWAFLPSSCYSSQMSTGYLSHLDPA